MSIIEAITRALPYDDMVDALVRNGVSLERVGLMAERYTALDEMISETLESAHEAL